MANNSVGVKLTNYQRSNYPQTNEALAQYFNNEFTKIQTAINSIEQALTTLNTWTPTDQSGAALTFTGVQNCYFIKVGRLILVTFDLTYPSVVSGLTAKIGNLPVPAFVSGSTEDNMFSGKAHLSNGTVCDATIVSANQIEFPPIGGGTLLTNTGLSTFRVNGAVTYLSAP